MGSGVFFANNRGQPLAGRSLRPHGARDRLQAMDLSRFEPPAQAWQQISVGFQYPVLFTRDCLDPDNAALAWSITRGRQERRHATLVVVDEGVERAWPNLRARVTAYLEQHQSVLEQRGPILVVRGGEAAKNDPQGVTRLLDAFADAHLDRHSAVVCIGGGAVLDAVGYAAALVHRGVRLVRVPTTVLAQGDGGVGVKNGINAYGAKNFLGTFAPPFAVVNDALWFETLEPRDIRAGLAEAVKVACIRDPQCFVWLENNAQAVTRPGPELEYAVRRCAELHLEHIRTSGDPFELGSARPLDFGHWAAHKLELLSAHDLRHGEAVNIGMRLDTHYSTRVGLLASSERDRLMALLDALGLPRSHPALTLSRDSKPMVLAGLDEFREHLGGKLSVTLLQRIGSGVEVNEIDTALMRECIDWLDPANAGTGT